MKNNCLNFQLLQQYSIIVDNYVKYLYTCKSYPQSFPQMWICDFYRTMTL